MQSTNFKDTICSSPATFVLAIILLVGARHYAGGFVFENWILTAGTIVLSFVLYKLSLANDLIRVRSWMIPSVYLLISAATHFVLILDLALSCVPFYVLSIFFLMKCYQQEHVERWIFPSFLFLYIGCLFFHPLVWMIPIFLIVVVVQLHAMSIRSLSAAILALLTVAEGAFIYLYLSNQSEILKTILSELMMFRLPFLTDLTLDEMLCFIILMFLYVIAMVHYFSSSNDDKIQTRTCFNILIFINLSMLAIFIFRPQDANITLQLLLSGMSPVIAHYFVFSKGFIANIMFVYSLILLILLYIIGTWGY